MKRFVVRVVAALALIGAGFYLSFELGRYQAGFSVLDARRRSEAMEAALAGRNQRIEELQRQIAILETSQDIDRETYDGVEANLAELESRIQAQEEELVFYRGIVSPEDGVPGLRIQSVEIVPAEGAAAYTLRVLLVQAIVHNDRLTGAIGASVHGTLDGEAVEYGLEEIGSEGGATEIPYGFRYFQALETGLALPEGFEPEEVEIRVWPRSPRGETIEESFAWMAVAR